MKRLITAFAVCFLTLFCCQFSVLPVSATTGGTTGDCTWSLDGTVLTISGTGEMENFYYSESSPWGKSVTKVLISDGVTSIGDYAFHGCDSLTAVTIGNSVTSIGEGAFFQCSSLRSITIPDSITNIGKYAFQNCYILNAVYITDFASWCEIDFPDPTSNPLYEAGNLYCNGKLITDLKIPNGVKKIGAFTFTGCNGVTSVTIPNSVTSIGKGAFWDCYGPTSITIPNSVTSIGDYAFYVCTSLTSITIPNSVTSIGDYAFSECTSLTSITIPDSVMSIENNVFSGCSKLISVTIPNSVTSISSYAFKGCQSLTSIRIPDGVEHIGDCAFLNCNNLKSIAIPDSVRSIGEKAFSGCSIDQFFCIENSDAHLYAADQGFACLFLPPVSAPTIESAIGNVIILTPIEGYEYSLDNVAWQDNSRFENLQPLIQYTFYQRIKAVGSYVAGYAGSGMVMAKPFAVAPTAPTIMEVTDDLVTLVPTVGYQYSKDGIKWQDSPQFDGLLPNTQYRFYARKAENENAYTSAASAACVVTTKRLTYTGAVSQPKLALAMATTVQLVAVEGYEYSVDGIVWQDNPTFSGLHPETSYTFYQRVTETNTTYASEKSESLIITTLKGYVISYEVGDGNNAPEKQIKTPGFPLTITLDTPYRDGYRFVGWSTTPDGKIRYSAGDEYIIDADTVLYAQWLKICTDCDGDGKIWGSCTKCGGDGKVNTPNGKCGFCKGKGVWCESCGASSSLLGGPCSSCGSKFFEYCEDCGGSGNELTQTSCSYCSSGKVEKQCTTCKGTGMSKEVKRIVLTEQPEKISFLKSENILVIVGGKITIHYTDDSSETKDLTRSMISGYNNSVTELQNLTITYCGKTTTYQTKVKLVQEEVPPAPIILSFTDRMVTLTSVAGCEYSKDGINWQNSPIFTELLPETNYLFYQRRRETATHYASAASDSLTVKTFELGVLTAITVKTIPSKTVYVESTVLDDSGMVLELIYSNGTDDTISTGWVSEYDFSVTGTRQVKVTYGGKTCTYSVTVVKKSVTAISVTTKPKKLVYLEAEAFDATGLVVTAYYNNGTSADITDYTISGYSSTPGVKTIIVSYGDFSDTFDIVVEAKKSGWVLDGSDWFYYLDGVKATGWQYVNDTWYYLNDAGVMQTGWLYVSNTWYYLNEGGAMQTGWLYVNNTWYYLNEGGAMTTGWQCIGGTWYYMNAGGAMTTGWLNLGGTWYYMNEGGAMTTGWQYIGNTWYYMNEGGAMQTGWLQLGGVWYFLADGGAMQTGWQMIGGVWYYFYDSGAMAVNCWIGNYWINAGGVWVA